MDGMKILQLAQQRLPDCEVVMVTGHATVPKAVEAMQLGAYNFLEKPLNMQRLRAVTAKAADVVLFGVYVFVFHIQAWWALWDLAVS